MNRFKMSPDINQSIVDGILQGYKNYIEERKAKREEMNISTAYAWVKGNHIDDQIAEECYDHGISFTKARAGYSWGYLQFNIDSEKRMFIIKNARYFNAENFPHPKGKRNPSQPDDETYLKKLSRINSEVDFPEEPSLFPKEEMVSLLSDAVLRDLEESEARRLEENFDQFYIITYEIDESFAISKIKVLMPNPDNNKAYMIDDLSEYIGASKVTLVSEDYDVLKESEIDEPEVPSVAEYGIVAVNDDAEKEEE